MMASMPPADPAIYHITHLSNLPSILKAGRLWSDAQRQRQGFPSENIGYSHIKARRLIRTVPVAAGGMLGDYVPFNFCSRSVMLYVVARGHENYGGGQEPIVHLVSSVQTAIATGRSWAFTERHEDLVYAQYYDDLANLKEIDWTVMPLVQWGGNSDTKEKRQAEFLVHDWFPWSAIEHIGVYDDAAASRVRSLIGAGTHNPRVTVQRSWYY